MKIKIINEITNVIDEYKPEKDKVYFVEGYFYLMSESTGRAKAGYKIKVKDRIICVLNKDCIKVEEG